MPYVLAPIVNISSPDVQTKVGSKKLNYEEIYFPVFSENLLVGKESEAKEQLDRGN